MRLNKMDGLKVHAQILVSIITKIRQSLVTDPFTFNFTLKDMDIMMRIKEMKKPNTKLTQPELLLPKHLKPKLLPPKLLLPKLLPPKLLLPKLLLPIQQQPRSVLPLPTVVILPGRSMLILQLALLLSPKLTSQIHRPVRKWQSILSSQVSPSMIPRKRS